jgi:hypothetical protein
VQRVVSVLLVVGVWTLTLLWQDRCDYEEEQQLAAHGACEGTNAHPATKSPKFGTHDERRTELDDESMVESRVPRPTRVVAELDRPPLVDDQLSRRHVTPRSARGPPTRG